MDSSFRTLKKDHVYFKQLLDELDSLLAKCQSGDSADWALIDHIVNTLHHYPEQSHHPMEDDFLSLLKSRHWISDMVIDTLQRDHQRLHQQGAQAQAQLSSLTQPCSSEPTEHTLQTIEQYVTAYRDHIRTEEELVFPMVEKLVATSASAAADYSPAPSKSARSETASTATLAEFKRKSVV